jgi:hypothetical protein
LGDLQDSTTGIKLAANANANANSIERRGGKDYKKTSYLGWYLGFHLLGWILSSDCHAESYRPGADAPSAVNFI